MSSLQLQIVKCIILMKMCALSRHPGDIFCTENIRMASQGIVNFTPYLYECVKNMLSHFVAGIATLITLYISVSLYMLFMVFNVKQVFLACCV